MGLGPPHKPGPRIRNLTPSLDVALSVLGTQTVRQVSYARTRFVWRPQTHVTPTPAAQAPSAFQTAPVDSHANAHQDHLATLGSNVPRASVRWTMIVLKTRPARITTV